MYPILNQRFFHMFQNRNHCFPIGLLNFLKFAIGNHRLPEKSLILNLDNFLAHPSRRLNVSYCDKSLSVVRRASVRKLFFKRHLLLNHWSKFHITSHKYYSMMPFFKIAQMVPLHLLGGLPELQIRNLLNDISSSTTGQNQNNFTELFLLIPSTKIAQMVLLCWTKGPQKLQIRNIFKIHLLLNH